MNNRLTILTCPSRDQSYLKNTIASFKTAGLDDLDFQKIIYVDGPADSYVDYPGWEIVSLTSDRLGTKKALIEVMNRAYQDRVDNIFYFEDDIIFAKNTLHVMVKVGVPAEIAFIAYCDLKDIGIHYGIATAPGFDPKAPPLTGGHWGNQALVIPYRSLDVMFNAEVPEWATEFASDVYISTLMACGNSPVQKYGVFFPSLVQHVGDVSLVQPTAQLNRWGRDTISFPGEDFDAATLPLEKLKLYEGKLVSSLTRGDLLKLRFRPNSQHKRPFEV